MHYSPSSRSALAEAELQYEENHVSHSVYISFQIDPKSNSMSTPLRELLSNGEKAHLLVWTTTPWTLTANMVSGSIEVYHLETNVPQGIAVNKDMVYSVLRQTSNKSSPAKFIILAKSRRTALEDLLEDTEEVADIQGSELVGCSYLPIFHHAGDVNHAGTSFMVIDAAHVTSESGTGLVHCAPAHGVEDYFAFRGLGLLSRGQEILCHVDADGKFTQDVIPIVGEEHERTLVGQEVLKGGAKAIVKILEHGGKLLKMEKIKHKYPYDWKTKQPIIVT